MHSHALTGTYTNVSCFSQTLSHAFLCSYRLWDLRASKRPEYTLPQTWSRKCLHPLTCPCHKVEMPPPQEVGTLVEHLGVPLLQRGTHTCTTYPSLMMMGAILHSGTSVCTWSWSSENYGALSMVHWSSLTLWLMPPPPLTGPTM